MEDYLNGKKLYGNDFSLEEIEKWFEEEKEGYANLGAKEVQSYNYMYHAQNRELGYKYLPENSKLTVLSIGGAYGDELIPIVNKIKNLHILEPSQNLRREKLQNIKINYHTPEVSGKMSFADNSFDLINCFGVLHHIPNVEYILSESARILKPNGRFLLREPIVSMGDWRNPRQGLTKNERGIPLELFDKFFQKVGLKVENKHLCFTKPFDLIFSKLTGKAAYNSNFYVKLDKILATLGRINYRYHANNNFQKIRPAGVFYVLSKNL